MCSAQVTKKNRAARLKSTPPWWVVEVQAQSGFRLHIRFSDGTQGIVEMAGLIEGDDPGVFASLRDSTKFMSVRVDHGAVVWSDNLDLAPDAMHAEISKNGSWIVL